MTILTHIHRVAKVALIQLKKGMLGDVKLLLRRILELTTGDRNASNRRNVSGTASKLNEHS